ncbi:hypothetical protein [Hymenobacter armeniacus]|uniref:Uncharacterized protein n=1 Tax=Hymenobacter armeniacus TaxID=2771358 RepID=A0ABR8JQ58_9BACT|nr:hypothetical protein [Hymenobacter armeniacus]MBD2721046.1 hypothetical protein [Hymenobacter armeniacus]
MSLLLGTRAFGISMWRREVANTLIVALPVMGHLGAGWLGGYKLLHARATA